MSPTRSRSSALADILDGCSEDDNADYAIGWAFRATDERPSPLDPTEEGRFAFSPPARRRSPVGRRRVQRAKGHRWLDGLPVVC